MVLGWFGDGLGMLLAEKEGREEDALLRVGREAGGRRAYTRGTSEVLLRCIQGAFSDSK